MSAEPSRGLLTLWNGLPVPDDENSTIAGAQPEGYATAQQDQKSSQLGLVSEAPDLAIVELNRIRQLGECGVAPDLHLRDVLVSAAVVDEQRGVRDLFCGIDVAWADVEPVASNRRFRVDRGPLRAGLLAADGFIRTCLHLLLLVADSLAAMYMTEPAYGTA